jgi:trimeric autotransporter adhesin
MLDRKTMWFMLLLAAVTMVIVMAGCSGDDNEETTGQQTAFLSGSQVTPNSNSLATGTATVTFVNLDSTNSDDQQVRVRLQTEGLTNVTTAQLRRGQPGETGPVLFTLFNRGTTNNQMPTDFTTTISASAWIPAGGVNTFAEFVSELRSGNVYVIVNTTANPNGEIRGQIGATRFSMILQGQPSSTLTPTATVTIDQTNQKVRLQMPNVGIPNATAVRFVEGGLGGMQLMSFVEQSAGPLGAIDITLGAGALIPQPSLGINNFNDFLNALYAGKVFLVVFTSSFPGGEYFAPVVRGGIEPQIFNVAMSSTRFVPATTNAPPGSIVKFKNNATTRARVIADATNLVAGGPNSNSQFPNGIGTGQTFTYRVPANAASSTNFFFHEATAGTAGNGTSVGTGMAGNIDIQ